MVTHLPSPHTLQPSLTHTPQCPGSCCSSVGSGGRHVRSAWWRWSSGPPRHTVKCRCLQHPPLPQSSRIAAGNWERMWHEGPNTRNETRISCWIVLPISKMRSGGNCPLKRQLTIQTGNSGEINVEFHYPPGWNPWLKPMNPFGQCVSSYWRVKSGADHHAKRPLG